MPLYEFRCSACEKTSEFQLKLADSYPELCPKCNQLGLVKIMSLPAFQLRGGGWYKDAYDGKSNKKPEVAPAADPKSSPAEASPGASPAAATPAAAPAPATSPAASPANSSGKGTSGGSSS